MAHSQWGRRSRWYWHKHTRLVELHWQRLAASGSFQVLDHRLLICVDHLGLECDSKQKFTHLKNVSLNVTQIVISMLKSRMILCYKITKHKSADKWAHLISSWLQSADLLLICRLLILFSDHSVTSWTWFRSLSTWYTVCHCCYIQCCFHN